MSQSGVALEKYWATQRIYFRLGTTVELCMGIADGNLLLCHGISEKIKYNTISNIEYNDRIVYDRFNDTISIDCSRPDLNLPHTPIDDIAHPNKRAWNTFDPLPAAIYVTPG